MRLIIKNSCENVSEQAAKYVTNQINQFKPNESK